ncbi:hypothetical protein F7725_024341 [Dissostichus mawsoni]|uniref:Secreted protein n=1 Tax=Dissostichus mawsoni TaxID=36200 RepID=A0A7J5XZ86_DISMA|nr:hypothetical protein F7725_024341 [Dissostichus mawsoni]
MPSTGTLRLPAFLLACLAGRAAGKHIHTRQDFHNQRGGKRGGELKKTGQRRRGKEGRREKKRRKGGRASLCDIGEVTTSKIFSVCQLNIHISDASCPVGVCVTTPTAR